MTYLGKHYDEIFKKYSLDELSKDIENYKYGEGKLNKVLAHFFEAVCPFPEPYSGHSKREIEEDINRILGG